jgi:uracil-DNA glycosylase family 4
MSFIPSLVSSELRKVPGEGPRYAKIVLVGEAPGTYESNQLRPFVGPAGTVLEQCLHTAGLIRSEIYITNVIKTKVKDIKLFFNEKTGAFTPKGWECVKELQAELNELTSSIIVTCGDLATAALTSVSKSHKYRGYIWPSVGLQAQKKVLPIIHPKDALYGMHKYRYLIATDLKKAKVESLSPGLMLPERKLVFQFGTLNEALAWLKYYEEAPIVSIDIEVLNHEVACIGFSSEPDLAISVPIAKQWTLEEEVLLWKAIQRVLGQENSIKVFQNGIFDIHFLLTRCGVVTRGAIHDTMIAHSVMYSELPKGLGFLGSLYCGTQPYWKDKVKFNNIKEES